MRRYHFLPFVLLILFISPVWADDATEAAATSNITFEMTPELIMQDETLTINRLPSHLFGEEQFSIHVDFHFKNTSDHNVTRTIAFALPPVQCRDDINTMWGGLENTDQKNTGLKDFTTTINGHPLVYTKRVEAMLGQQNITNLLTMLKIPLNPCQIHSTPDGDPDPRFSTDLMKYHLLTENNEPAWSENIYFEWQQVFPARQVVHIQHHYTPVSGESVPAPRSIKDLNDWFTGNSPPMYSVWNKNPDTLAKNYPDIIHKDNYAQDNQLRLCLIPEWIRYRLTTGAYWKKGIGLFKLVIIDGQNKPFAVNEFYKKDDQAQTFINGNTMTFSIKNFIPTQDLLVLFLSVPKMMKNSEVCPSIGSPSN